MEQFPDEPRKYITMVSAHFYISSNIFFQFQWFIYEKKVMSSLATSVRLSIGASFGASVCRSVIEVFLVNDYTASTKPQSHI